MIEQLSELRIRLRALFRRPAVEQELDDELHFHLERQTEAFVRAGLPRAEALRRARLGFGGLDAVKEECREARGVTLLETLLQDLRFGLRLLLGTPGLTAAAVLTLALGIGANSAILSAAHRVLWRPLPFPQAERLVFLRGGSRLGGGTPISAPNFLDLQEQNRSFSHLATFGAASFVVEAADGADGPRGAEGGAATPEWLRAGRVSPDFFAVLGRRAALGRTFLPEEGREGREKVAVLGHAFWLRRFGGDRAIVGKRVDLNAAPYTIVGVLPEGFGFTIPGVFKPAELWVPAVLSREESQRANNELRVIARLRPGVSPRQAQADLESVSRRLATAFPGVLAGLELRLVPLREMMTGEVRPLLRILLGAVALLLLIACANVAGLQLVRASARRKEIALRLALGAGRARLVRQLLTESLLLALAGGGLGLLLASSLNAGTHLLGALLPTGLPGGAGHGLDPGAVAGAVLLSLGSGFLFGLAPALQAARTRGSGAGSAGGGTGGLSEVLKEGGRSAGEGRSGGRLRGFLMAGEVALALVLLAGAGLLGRSFLRVLAERPGFDIAPVLTQDLRLPRYAYPDGAKQSAFYHRALERLAALPGVEAVGGIDDLPLTPDRDAASFAIEGGEPWDAGRSPVAQIRTVTPDYFRAMGIPVLRGRPFAPSDSDAAPPVVLVNRTLARRMFGTGDPVGRRLLFGANASPAWLTIVGEVGDTRDLGLANPAEPEIYLPYDQSPLSYCNVVLRVSGDPGRLAHAATAALNDLDRGLPLAPAQPMRDVVAGSLAQRRFSLILMGLFALVALALAAAGIYGVLSYSAERRSHEIGVRMALGAQRREIFRLVIGRSLAVTALGLAAGIVAALASTRLLGGLLYGVPASDPWTLAGVALLLFAVAALAGFVPARRATEVSPVTALRSG